MYEATLYKQDWGDKFNLISWFFDPVHPGHFKDHIAIFHDDSFLVIYNSTTLEKGFEIDLKDLGFISSDLPPPVLKLKEGKLYIAKDQTLHVLDISTKEKKQFQLNAAFHFFAIEGGLLAMAKDQRIALWDLQKGTLLTTHFAPEAPVTALALHRLDNGLLELVAGLEDGRIQIWNPQIELDAREKERASMSFLSRAGDVFWSFLGWK